MDLVLRAVGVLAKLTYFFRPARFDVSGGAPTISVIGDVATVRYRATLKRGLFLWFLEGGRFTIPVPKGLYLAMEVTARNPVLEADFREAEHHGVIVSVAEAQHAESSDWPNGALVDIEVKVRCETMLMVDTEEEQRRFETGGMRTTVVVRKRRELEDVVIRGLLWRRTLRDLIPLRHVSVSKNGEPKDMVVQIVKTSMTREKASSAKVGQAIEGCGGEGLSRADRLGELTGVEMIITMSFESPADEYRITFESDPP